MKRRSLLQHGATGLGLSIAGVPLHLLAAGRKGGVINVIVQPEPSTLMLGLSQTAGAQLVGGNVYEGLLRYDEQMNPMANLAVSWTVAPDGLRYVFNLKQNAFWHDGKPFTASDVVFSADVFLRKTHPRVKFNLQAVEAIRAVNPHTVEFILKHPFAPFLGIFEVGSMPMIPRHVYEGTDFATNPANATPIGTGPFKFKEWVKGSHIQLVRNDKYHEKDVPLAEGVYFHVIPDAASRAAAFESGKIDVAPGGSVELFDIQRLVKSPGAAVTTKGWEYFAPLSWLWINNRRAPMDNVKFRQAIMHAIDREAICNVAWFGYAKPATGPLNSKLRFYTSDVRKYPRNLNAAKKLLAESGYKGETLRLMPLPYGETWARTAEIVRQNLAQAGIPVQLTQTDVAGWTQKLSEWDYDLAFTFVYQQGDAALGVSRTYTSANIAKGSPFNNVEGYSNAKVDELFEQAGRQLDVKVRRQNYEQVQKILVEDVPVAWLFEINFPTLYRAKIGNLVNSAIGLNDSLGRATVS